jgi:hypothetical protein
MDHPDAGGLPEATGGATSRPFKAGMHGQHHHAAE